MNHDLFLCLKGFGEIQHVMNSSLFSYVKVSVKFNIIPEPPKTPPFDMKVATSDVSNPEKHSPCYLYNIHVCTR